MEGNIFKPSAQAEKFWVLMITHFSGITVYEIEKLKCEICQDFIEKYCVGKKLKGKEAALCMWERACEVDIEIQRKIIQ